MTTPLISTRTMVGLGEAIEATLGGSVLRAAIDVSGLPHISFFTHRAYLPHLGQLAFLEAVAQRSEGKLARILANQLQISEYGAFGKYIMSGQNYGAALARTVAGTRWHLSHDRISLARHGDMVRLTYLSYVRFDCETLSLDLEIDMLSRLRLGSPLAATTIEDVVRESSCAAPRDLVGVTKQLIRLAVLDGDVRLDAIAEQLRLGPRTFRRRLGAAGGTFRELVARHRADRAMELLRDGTYSVSDVALSLGYSDAAHFVRAFKRETGRTPGELRSLN